MSTKEFQYIETIREDGPLGEIRVIVGNEIVTIEHEDPVIRSVSMTEEQFIRMKNAVERGRIARLIATGAEATKS